jgi:hypothetical protein
MSNINITACILLSTAKSKIKFSEASTPECKTLLFVVYCIIGKTAKLRANNRPLGNTENRCKVMKLWYHNFNSASHSMDRKKKLCL